MSAQQDKSKALKRKVISLETKIQVLDRLRSGEGSSAVAKHFDLHEATVRTIKKNEESIRSSVAAGTSVSVKHTSYKRDAIMENMEKALVTWIEDKNQKRIPIDSYTIKQKALRIFERLKEATPSTSQQTNCKFDFTAGKGWIENLKRRHNLHNVKTKGESASSNELAASEFPQILSKIIEEGAYTAEQIFNADETGLFWKKMPSRTFISKAEKTAGGFKVSKDRITLLFCSNASGDHMMKPMLIKPKSNERVK